MQKFSPDALLNQVLLTLFNNQIFNDIITLGQEDGETLRERITESKILQNVKDFEQCHHYVPYDNQMIKINVYSHIKEPPFLILFLTISHAEKQSVKLEFI